MAYRRGLARARDAEPECVTVALSVPFLVENVLQAIIIIAYLFYEIHWGRLNRLANTLDEVVRAVIALARETRGVDEAAVVDRLNGHTPKDLLTDEEKKRAAKRNSAERPAERRGDP